MKRKERSAKRAEWATWCPAAASLSLSPPRQTRLVNWLWLAPRVEPKEAVANAGEASNRTMPSTPKWKGSETGVTDHAEPGSAEDLNCEMPKSLSESPSWPALLVNCELHCVPR